LTWGRPQSPPILALHGWLDNAASFQPLANVLAQHFFVVALDLSGHGESDWRSADATYQIYDDLPQIMAVVQQLGWPTFRLMGHSRGAIIATLLAAAFAEQVSHLVLLDGAVPAPLEAEGFVPQMRQFMVDKQRLLQREHKVYASSEQAIAVRQEQGLQRPAAELIALRNLRSCAGGVCWRTDPRLRGASAVKLSAAQIDAVLAALTMPTLLLAAQQGLAASHPELLASLVARMPAVQLENVPGGHHFHMEEGVDTLGNRLQRFLLDRG